VLSVRGVVVEVFEEVGIKVLEERKNYPDIDLRRAVIDYEPNEFAKLRNHVNRRLSVIKRKYVGKDISALFDNFKKFCDFLGGEAYTYHEKTEHSATCSLDKDLTITIDKAGKLHVNGKSMDVPVVDYKFEIYLAIVQHVDKSKPDVEYVLADVGKVRYWVASSSGLMSDKLVSKLPKQRIELSVDVVERDIEMYCVPANSPEEAIAKVFKWGIAYNCSKMKGEKFQYVVVLTPIYQYVSTTPMVSK